MPLSFHVLIPAGGTGSRFDASVPKQFHELNGKPVLTWSVRPFIDHPEVSHIWILHARALPALGQACLNALKASHPNRISLLPCAGETRAETVRNGCQHIHALHGKENPWILVHDAARPGLTLAALQRLLDSLAQESVGAILAVPTTDTLKLAHDGRIQRTLSRAEVWQAQTPQAFRVDMLLNALTGDIRRFSDEASAVEALGYSPALVEGDPANLKLTRKEDQVLLEQVLKEWP